MKKKSARELFFSLMSSDLSLLVKKTQQQQPKEIGIRGGQSGLTGRSGKSERSEGIWPVRLEWR